MIARVAALVLALTVGAGACGSNGSAPGAATPEAAPESPERIAYGEGASQFGDLWLPSGANEGAGSPVVVLLHGGFWYSGFALDLMDPLAADLVEDGYAVWNVEYRRVGQDGGGVPGTLDDVDAAFDYLATIAADREGLLDLDEVSIVGHSAGGHLALWLGGASTGSVKPAAIVAQAPVFDLEGALAAGVGGTAVSDFVGGLPEDVPDAYALAQPEIVEGLPTTVVHGEADSIVPIAQGEAASAAGADLVSVPDADHFAMIDAASEAWRLTKDALAG